MSKINRRVKKFEYGLRDYPQGLEPGEAPIAYSFKLGQLLRSGIETEKLANHPGPTLVEGLIDWQDGLTFKTVRAIEPADFVAITERIHAAMCEARRLLGEQWCCSEPTPGLDGYETNRLMFLTQRREEPLGSLNAGPDARGVIFSVHRIIEWKDADGTVNEELDVPACLQGEVDGAHGVTLYRQEQIEPGEFISIMACAHEAICASRTMIGSHWKCSEP